MDEYVEFMQNYDPSDLSSLSAYMDVYSKYMEFAVEAESWSGDDMNNEELLYYTEVITRVSKKLLTVL